MLTQLAFYVFAFATVGAAAAVVTVKNPVHAVLFLILTFLSAAALMVLLGAEFLALILAIVYVGAVAVLFLFVVMMLDINFAELRSGFQNYLPVGLIVAAVLLLEIALIIGIATGEGPQLALPVAGSAGEQPADITNTEALGRVLYTDYLLAFQASGLILLVAMIGAITLTLRHRPGVRRQKVAAQLARRPEDVLRIHRDQPAGEGGQPSRGTAP